MAIAMAGFGSPLGEVRLAVRENTLLAMGFADHWPVLEAGLTRRFPGARLHSARDPGDITGRLRRYFDGDLAALDDIAVEPGGTPFQLRVWSQLRRIPAGRTASYRDVAHAIGAARAVRAVGAANGANPIWLVVPCHRVIAADGSLCGYGGGVDRKRWLLEHEGARVRGACGEAQLSLAAGSRG